jgi:hypothetical protein
MAMQEHTIEIVGPDAKIDEDLGMGAMVSYPPPVPLRILTTIESTLLAAVQQRLPGLGYSYVGSGNQLIAAPSMTQIYSTTATTVPAPGTWSAPTVGSFAGGVLSLLDAAANNDLNTVVGWLGTVKDQVMQHDTEIATNRKLINAIIDVLQAHGLMT